MFFLMFLFISDIMERPKKTQNKTKQPLTTFTQDKVFEVQSFGW